MVNVQRLLALNKVPQENLEGTFPLDEFTHLYPKWPDQGKLVMNDVVLKYRPTTEVVLDKLTFTAQPGEKIGVVGRTGAGKSTICLSLSRIVEIVEGSI